MKSNLSRSVPFKRCKFIYDKLVKSKTFEIHRNDLRRIISKYIASTKKIIDEYENRFVDFGFLNYSIKLRRYSVNQEYFFCSKENQNSQKLDTTYEKTDDFNDSFNCTIKNDLALKKIFEKSQQSKTLVYPVEGERKVTLSFKGYKSIWDAFKKAVWDAGFPDICYVEHIFHRAFSEATLRNGRIDIPFSIRNINFFITIDAPYIVQRPRRRITMTKKEIIEE